MEGGVISLEVNLLGESVAKSEVDLVQIALVDDQIRAKFLLLPNNLTVYVQMPKPQLGSRSTNLAESAWKILIELLEEWSSYARRKSKGIELYVDLHER